MIFDADEVRVDGSLLTQNVRNLLTGMMTEYRIE